MVSSLFPKDDSSRHVLYIEDNRINQRVVSLILARYSTICLALAEDAESGLAAVSHQCPDLLLLDINLPDRDGFAVFRELRSNVTLPYFPIVAVSANALPDDIERARALGFDEYIVKPIYVAEFKQVIQRFLPGVG